VAAARDFLMLTVPLGNCYRGTKQARLENGTNATKLVEIIIGYCYYFTRDTISQASFRKAPET
jgi:hypothetical protein